MSYRLTPRKRASITQRFADERRDTGTQAERELERILNEVNGGVLVGHFQREWAFGGQWILDFFFWELRLGIEVDGAYHQRFRQMVKDAEKEFALEQFGVTLVRLSNDEVFGDREVLLEKLRDGWRQARKKRLESENKLVVAMGKRRAKEAQRRKLGPRVTSRPFFGGWTSIAQGQKRMGDTSKPKDNRARFIDLSFGGSREAIREMKRRDFVDLKKRSRG